MDEGAWWVTAHGVAKSQTRLSDFTHSLRKKNKLTYITEIRASPASDTAGSRRIHAAFRTRAGPTSLLLLGCVFSLCSHGGSEAMAPPG